MDRISTPLPPPPHPLSSTHERWCSQLEGKFQGKHKKAYIYSWRTIILDFGCKISKFTNFSWFCSTKASIFSIHQEFLSHLKEMPPFFFFWFVFLISTSLLLRNLAYFHSPQYSQHSAEETTSLFWVISDSHQKTKLLLFSRRSKNERINSSMSEKQDIFFTMCTF